MTKQARSPTPNPKTVRLLDVANLADVRERPLRSMIALADRVLDADIRANILKTCGDDAYCRLVTALECSREGSSEDMCRQMLEQFADAMGDPAPFFGLLNEGQIQLAQRIGNLVGGHEDSVDPTLIYAPCGLSFHPTATYGQMVDRLERKDGDGSSRAEAPTHEETRELDAQISELEHRGWPQTSEQQVRLEQLRGRRAQLIAPEPPPSRKSATLRATALHRALGKAEGISREAMALDFLLVQGRIHTGLVPDLLALADQVAAQLREMATAGAPAGEASARNVRYLNADEHQFLERAVRDPEGIVTYSPTPSSVAERMDSAGLLDLLPNEGGKRRAKITQPGRRALQTWRYEVPTG